MLNNSCLRIQPKGFILKAGSSGEKSTWDY